jgi:hypothetical protein
MTSQVIGFQCWSSVFRSWCVKSGSQWACSLRKPRKMHSGVLGHLNSRIERILIISRNAKSRSYNGCTLLGSSLIIHCRSLVSTHTGPYSDETHYKHAFQACNFTDPLKIPQEASTVVDPWQIAVSQVRHRSWQNIAPLCFRLLNHDEWTRIEASLISYLHTWDLISAGRSHSSLEAPTYSLFGRKYKILAF